MLIYYAHSKLIYDTKREKEEIEIIQDAFTNSHIINPNGWIYNNKRESDIMEQCYIFVKQSDIIIFSSVDGFIGKGVYNEIQRAFWYDKDVYYLSEDRLYKFNNFNDIEIFNRGWDWKKFAKVKVFE